MSDRPILMIPGPTEIPWRVIQAMMRPSVPHYDPAFNIEVLDTVLLKLRKVFQTENEVFAFPGSGRVALEAAVTSVIEEGDKVLCVVAGVFGDWIQQMVGRIGGQVVPLEVPWGQPIDLDKLEDMLKAGGFKALTVVHNETSSGAMYPIAEIGTLTQRYDVLYLVDTVSSLAGADVRTDEWGIDIAMSAPNKCLAAPIGLSLDSVSARAWDAMRRRKKPATSFSYDLLRWRTMWLPPERGGDLIYGWRRQPVTMPVHTVYALDAAVDIVLEEGLAARFERHEVSGRAVRAGLEAMGLQVFAAPSVASNTVTCAKVPPGLSSREIGGLMRERHRILIARGLGEDADQQIRIGHMGLTASPQYVLPGLAALESVLLSMGAEVLRGSGIRAAQETFAEAGGW